MPEKNEGVVRRMIDEVWNKGNLTVLDQVLTPDFTEHDPVDPAKGIDAVKNNVKKYRTAFPDCRLDIEEVFSAGDRVVVRFRYHGTHRNPLEGIAPTGKRVTGPGITIYYFTNDRIREAHTNWDALGLLQQLGVVTLPGKAFRAGV